MLSTRTARKYAASFARSEGYRPKAIPAPVAIANDVVNLRSEARRPPVADLAESTHVAMIS